MSKWSKICIRIWGSHRFLTFNIPLPAPDCGVTGAVSVPRPGAGPGDAAWQSAPSLHHDGRRSLCRQSPAQPDVRHARAAAGWRRSEGWPAPSVPAPAQHAAQLLHGDHCQRAPAGILQRTHPVTPRSQSCQRQLLWPVWIPPGQLAAVPRSRSDLPSSLSASLPASQTSQHSPHGPCGGRQLSWRRKQSSAADTAGARPPPSSLLPATPAALPHHHTSPCPPAPPPPHSNWPEERSPSQQPPPPSPS